MFASIFRYELGYWVRQPSIYAYCSILFLIAAVSLVGSAGGFDGGSAALSGQTLLNAPINLAGVSIRFSIVVMALVPTIVGMSVYRDFSSNMHVMLFSFPFSRKEYLLAKFASSFLIALVVAATIGLGFIAAEQYPGLDPVAVGPTNLWTYAAVYGILIIPNLLFFSAIVFYVVGTSRNIYAGFIVVLFVIVASQLAGGLLRGLDSRILASLMDPFGETALDTITRYWTVSEINQRSLPFSGVLVYNRLIWTGISLGLLAVGFQSFSFGQTTPAFSMFTKKVSASTRLEPTNRTTTRLIAPRVTMNHGLIQSLQTTWFLSRFEFRHVARSWSFVAFVFGSVVVTAVLLLSMNKQYIGKIVPVTWSVLEFPTFFFSGVIILMTFLYAGLFVNRDRLSQISEIVDVTPVPNWSLLVSKGIALLRLQALMLLVIMVGGIVTQILQGFYDISLSQYVFRLFVLGYIGFAIWSAAALVIQTIFSNQYLGLFLLIIGMLGLGYLPDLGIHDSVFRFNTTPGGFEAFEYSDLSKYGSDLSEFVIYKMYWLLFAVFLMFASLIFWRRGIPERFIERLRIAGSRLTGWTGVGLATSAVLFVIAGATIWTHENISIEPRWTDVDYDRWSAENEKRFKAFEQLATPRIVRMSLDVGLFPGEERYVASGTYVLVNQSYSEIDSFLVGHGFSEITTINFDRPNVRIIRDEYMRTDRVIFEQPLTMGDSVNMMFEIRSIDNTPLRSRSRVERNGTSIPRTAFPVIGYRPIELEGAQKRLTYGLREASREMAAPEESVDPLPGAVERDARVDVDLVVSTTRGQIPIAPGTLQDEWEEDGRVYRQYVTDLPIKDELSIQSAGYSVYKDSWNEIDIEIYHHPDHQYNLESIANGIKSALEYGSERYGRYPHPEIRVAEFPLTQGSYATLLGNMMPMSEMNFIVDVDHTDQSSIDLPFYVAAHEVAHEWWGKQIHPADALGSKMMTEGLAEYMTLQVLRKKYGIEKMTQFITQDLDLYLSGRSDDSGAERTLLRSRPEQEYINYRKASIVFTTLAEMIGEETLNSALASFLDSFRYNETDRPTSLDLYEEIKTVIPDSLSYLGRDMFESITLYDNRVEEVTITPSTMDSVVVDVKFLASKYRVDGSGELLTEIAGGAISYQLPSSTETIQSEPLADYIDVAVYSENIYGQRYVLAERTLRVDSILNSVTFVVPERPTSVVVDPRVKLIDRNSRDNIWQSN